MALVLGSGMGGDWKNGKQTVKSGKNGEEIVAGGWKNGDLCFIVAKQLAKVLPMAT